MSKEWKASMAGSRDRVDAKYSLPGTYLYQVLTLSIGVVSPVWSLVRGTETAPLFLSLYSTLHTPEEAYYSVCPHCAQVLQYAVLP